MQTLLGVENHIGLTVEGEVVAAVEFGDTAGGAHATLVDPGCIQLAGDDVRGFMSGLFHISGRELPGQRQNIAPQWPAPRVSLVYEGGIGFHGFQRIENGR